MAPCLSSIRAERLRVAKLEAGGAPAPGPENGYISDAQVSVDVGLEIEEGDEIIQKNGGGRLCAAFKDVDRIKSATLDIDLCQLDAELLALTTGGTVIGDPPIGFMPPSGTASLENPVCAEVWTRAWDGGSQASLPGSTDAAYWHFVFPNVKFTPGEFTLDDQTHVFPISGSSQENHNITPDGPFNDWPQPVQDVGGITRVYGVFLDGVPPDENCGAVEVPAQPAPGAASGATAGTPGTWTPPGSQAPATVADLIAGTPNAVTASPTTAWTTGEYVQTQASGTGGRAYWNGTAWTAGSAT
jgi:hypothetical protein